MCFCVFQHVVLPDESFATYVTFVRFLPRVQTHMTPEVSFVVELFRTNFALVRLLPRVFAQMFLEEELGREPLPTCVTLEWLVTRMETLVVLCEITRFVKHFVTIHALMHVICSYFSHYRLAIHDQGTVFTVQTAIGSLLLHLMMSKRVTEVRFCTVAIHVLHSIKWCEIILMVLYLLFHHIHGT